MANTGNIIHPHVVQYFNSGPDSGSVVSSSFIISFSGSFTSSILCEETYSYSVYDPVNCPVDGACLPPTFITGTVVRGGRVPDEYTILINTNTSSISTNEIEFAYNQESLISGTSTGSFIIDTTGSVTNEYSRSFALEDTNIQLILMNCTIGDVYFRSRNVCVSGSSYSEWVYSSGIGC